MELFNFLSENVTWLFMYLHVGVCKKGTCVFDG